MQKGLHAPRYSEVEFRGYPSICKKNICFVRKGLPFTGYPSICKQNICFIAKGLPFNRGILFRSNPIFLNGRVCQPVISFMETYPIPKVFLSKQARVHAPWVSIISSESLVLIRRTDWGLMRHSLHEKTIQGWYMTIFYV